jgi:hypothetical protein
VGQQKEAKEKSRKRWLISKWIKWIEHLENGHVVYSEWCSKKEGYINYRIEFERCSKSGEHSQKVKKVNPERKWFWGKLTVMIKY